MNRIYSFLSILLFFTQTAAAQIPPVSPFFSAELLDSRQGLPTPYIKVTYCDDQNRLWLASGHDIFRYDGYHFESLKDKIHLEKADVINFTQNPEDGSIWFDGGADGPMIWRVSVNDDLQAFPLPHDVFGKHSHHLHFSPDGHLWLATQTGVWCYTPDEVAKVTSIQKLFRPSLPPVLSGSHDFLPLPIIDDGSPNGVYFPVNNQVFQAAANGRQARLIGAVKGKECILSMAYSPHRPDKILLGLNHPQDEYGIIELNNDGSFRLLCKTDDHVGRIIFSPDGKTFWYSDGNCLGSVDCASGNLLSLELVWGNLPIGFIMDMAMDREGDFWFGTNAGLAALRRLPMAAKGFPHMSREWQNGVYSTIKDPKGRMLIGANSGKVYLFDGNNGFKEYKLPSGGIITHEIHNMLFDRSGDLWMFNNWLGIQCARGGKMLNFGQNEGLPMDNYISDFFLDNNDRLWVGSGVGVAYMDGASNARSNSKFNFIKKNTPALAQSGDIECFGEYPKGVVWIGTGKGLFRYNRQNAQFERMAEDTTTIHGIWFSPEGDCWATTDGKGVLRFAPDAGKMRLSEEFNDPVWRSLRNPRYIQSDVQGNLWISTGLGITLLKKMPDGTRVLQCLDHRDGLPSGNHDGLRIFCNGDTVWCATFQGLTYFRPSTLSAQTEPEAHISTIRVNGVLHNASEKQIQTDWHSVLELHFFSASPANAPRTRYEIRMSGPQGDSTWITEQRSVAFNQMNSGLYKIQIRAVNGAGIWQSKPAELQLHVQSFWLSPRVLGIGAVAMLAMFLLWILMQLKREQEKRMDAEKLAQKEKETNDLHHELSQLRVRHTEVFDLSHRQTMGTHILQHLWHNAYALNCAGEHDATRDYLLRLRQFYGLATEIGKNLFISLNQEKKFLEEYLSLEGSRLPQLKSSVQIDAFESVEEQEDEPGSLKIPAFMLQTLVENAIRYAFATKVDHWEIQVRFLVSAREQTITCTVQDNGLGMDAAQNRASNPWKSTSYGFESIRQRIVNFNQSLLEHEAQNAGHHIPEASIRVEKAFPDDAAFPGTKITIVFPDSLDTWALEYFKTAN